MVVADKTTLQQYLQKFFGFDTFKGQQEEIISSLLAKKDTFVIMPTGGGKSLCYQLPALVSEGTAIIISPLIALMKNQVDALRNFGNEDGIAHFLNSSLTKPEIAKVKKDITDGKTKLLYVAPESLTKQENVIFFNEIKISFFAIDEAHCISEWGHDFRPEYRRIRTIIEEIGTVPIIALTATATPKVQQDIQKNLGMTDANVYKSSFNRGNLYYEVRPKQNVIKEIIKYVKTQHGKSGIIYCLSRKKVEELAETLRVNGVKAQAYHAGLEAKERAHTQDAFLMEDIDVRGITNISSGKMGAAIANTAESMGAKVTLITSNHKDYLKNINAIYVSDAQSMHDAVLKHISDQDIFISVAAVSDFKPKEKLNGKLKKDTASMNLQLEPTIDILKEVGLSKNKIFKVGFAAESENLIENAKKKLRTKNLDLIVANLIQESMGLEDTKVSIIDKNTVIDLPKSNKIETAKVILEEIARHMSMDK